MASAIFLLFSIRITKQTDDLSIQLGLRKISDRGIQLFKINNKIVTVCQSSRQFKPQNTATLNIN